PQFSPERRTSSLAAPPPSSVSGLIEDTNQTSQHTQFIKIKKRYKLLISLGDFGVFVPGRCFERIPFM
ncbi:hypothetical protein, partial [Rhizobium skierniewicense]|uniref:hypothetical protein n=1 Tax=Rhizobium skierniewicense TaxID=984260 RepID=UPI001AEE9191